MHSTDTTANFFFLIKRIQHTCVRLSLLARAAAILGATLRVRLDMRRNGLELSSSIAAKRYLNQRKYSLKNSFAFSFGCKLHFWSLKYKVSSILVLEISKMEYLGYSIYFSIYMTNHFSQTPQKCLKFQGPKSEPFKFKEPKWN